MSKLVIASHIAKVVRDKGGVKKDKDGYYYVRLGTFGVPVASGILYLYDENLKKVLRDPNSPLNFRLKSGYLRSEYGHPQRKPGMSDNDYFARLQRLEPTLQCANIRELVIHENKEAPNSATVYGWVRPSGPYADCIIQELEDDNVNSAWSVRTIAEQFVKNGRVVRIIKSLFTWDYVTTPGVSNASKIGALEELIVDLNDADAVSMFRDNVSSKMDSYETAGMEEEVRNSKEILDIIEECTGSNCLVRYWNS
jgi:hypothetical protein